MATNKTPGGTNVDDLEASNRKLMGMLVERLDPFTHGRSRKGESTQRRSPGARTLLMKSNRGVKLTPAEERRLKTLQQTFQFIFDLLIKETATPQAVLKAEITRSLTESGQLLQEDVKFAMRFYEKARRHLSSISEILRDSPYRDSENTTGKTVAKDEGLLQRPQQQQPAKSAERIPTVRARTETTQRLTKALRPDELSEFLAHAAAHPWESNSGVRPSDHIKTQFAKWLKLGLSRSDLIAAQPNLAQAYATETSRDPTRRIKGLVVRPHKLPPGAKPAISMRPVWQLTKKELEAKRALEREKKQRQRQRQKDATFTS